MNRNEELTRQAAQAVGRDVSGLKWSDEVLGLVNEEGLTEVFAPMSDPCDAYMVEACAQISVRYEIKNGVLAIYYNSHRHPELGYMNTALIDDKDLQIKARMYGATQFAAILAMVES